MKKIRLFIATQSPSDIHSFYWRIIREHSANLVPAVKLFYKPSSANLSILFAYFSRLKRKEQHWDWVLKVKPASSRIESSPNGKEIVTPMYQAFYTRDDELLAKLQDQEWRGAFNAAYTLHIQYGALFTTTLHYPVQVERLIHVAAEKAELNKQDPVALERLGVTLYRCLCSPAKLLEWYANNTQSTTPNV